MDGKERLIKGSKDADKIKAVAELRTMAGLSQGERSDPGPGLRGGVMLSRSDVELLSKALIAYEREGMTIDGVLHDVESGAEGSETHDDDG